MATIGVEGVEIVIYKAEEYITTLVTAAEGHASTLLEAATYRVEYWFKGKKMGEHEITVEVDSYVIWAFPAVLRHAEIVEKIVVALIDVRLAPEVVASIADEVFAHLVPVLTQSIADEISAVLYPFIELALTQTISVVLYPILEQALTQTIDVVLHPVLEQSLTTTVTASLAS